MQSTTISVTRWQLKPKPGWLPNWKWLLKHTHEEIEVEIKVDVEGEFCPGEPEASDCPGERGYVEFRSASVDGKPFDLWADEIFIAEEEMLSGIRDELPYKWQRQYNI